MQQIVALNQINKNEKGSNVCPDTKPFSDGIVHMDIKCHICSNMGHHASKYPDMKPKKIQWVKKGV